nr:MAG TPA: hypothetical protein [Bacteriophage sp.]
MLQLPCIDRSKKMASAAAAVTLGAHSVRPINIFNKHF